MIERVTIIPNGEAQAGFLSDFESRHCVFLSGWGGGKTWAGGRKAGLLACENHAPFILVGQDLTHLHGTMVPELWSFCEEELGIYPRYTDMRKRLLLRGLRLDRPRGGDEWVYAHLFTAENPGAIRAVNASHGWYDEPAAYKGSAKRADRRTLLQIIGRLRGTWPIMQHIYTGTEEGRHTEFHSMISGDLSKQLRKGGNRISIYRGSTLDNIDNVGQEFVDDVVATVPVELHDQYLRGGVGDLQQAMAWWNWSDEFIDESATYTPGYPLIWSLDFGLAPLASSVHQKHGTLTQADAITYTLCEHVHKSSGNLEALAEAMAERWSPIHDGEVYVMGDASGQHGSLRDRRDDYKVVLDVLRTYWPRDSVRLRVDKSNPRIASRLIRHNQVLARGMHRVHPSAENLIRDMQGCALTDTGSGVHEDQSDGYSHSGVGVSYMFWKNYPGRSSIELPSSVKLAADRLTTTRTPILGGGVL